MERRSCSSGICPPSIDELDWRGSQINHFRAREGKLISRRYRFPICYFSFVEQGCGSEPMLLFSVATRKTCDSRCSGYSDDFNSLPLTIIDIGSIIKFILHYSMQISIARCSSFHEFRRRTRGNLIWSTVPAFLLRFSSCLGHSIWSPH